MTECIMQNTGDYGFMAKTLIDKQKSSGKPIPTDAFNLAIYVHDTMGKYMSDTQQKQVFYALAKELKLQQQPNSQNEKSINGTQTLDESIEKSASQIDDYNMASWIPTPNNNNNSNVPFRNSISTNPDESLSSCRNPSKPFESKDQSITNLSDFSSMAVGDSATTVLIKDDNNYNTSGRNLHSAPKVRKCTSEIIRCSKVGPYVLIDETTRCPDSHTPEAKEIRFKVEFLLYLEPSDPFYQYEMAERHIEDSDLISSSWQESIVCFTKASAGFVNLGLFRMAANCYVRISDCYRICGCEDDVAKSLVTVSHLHQKESDNLEGQQAALAAIQNAVDIFLKLGRELKAASLSTEVAELCIKADNAGLGIDILHLAQDTMQKFGQYSNARRALLRATEISVLDFSDFGEAIDSLEKIAVLPPASTSHLYYFRAMVCRIVCVPIKGGVDTYEAILDVKKVFEDYMDLCPRLSYGSERKLLLTMIDSLKTLNEEALNKECEKYIASHKSSIEEWLDLVLKRICDNVKSRNAAIMALCC
eukprot:Tbor_TRINITY_DN5410_c3_g1::TRINITY_DN5410_c3_g1_i1::g.25377::m.25377